jgi:hypothetical protein
LFTFFYKIRLPAFCFVFSIVAHILFVFALRISGTYNFSAPVNPGVVVTLAGATDTASGTVTPEKQESSGTDREDTAIVKQPPPAQEGDDDISATHPEQRTSEPEPVEMPVVGQKSNDHSTGSGLTTTADSADKSRQTMMANPTTPMRAGSQFLGAKYEKLSYLISMLGIPVGSAELEAKNEKGDISITLKVRSNAAISSIFPVNDSIETRHFGGRFIMTKIRQQEGFFKSATGFTLNLREKKVFWIDNITGFSSETTVPTDDVLDTLSGIYFLRNRQLQVGRTETLHIFDSETYADVPVEILRREEMRLPNLQKVATLVVRPLQQTAGIFRRTGDILIWMTDDDNKVPVKIATSIALGRVTVELVSAESKPAEEEVKKK